MPSRTIEESHRPRVSDRTMRCHSLSGQSSGLLFQKRWVPSQQQNGTTGKKTRFSASHAETTTLRSEEDHSPNGWAECREKNRHRAEGELFSLDISSYRTLPVSAFTRPSPKVVHPWASILPGVGSRESRWQSAHGIGPPLQTSRTVCGPVHSYSAVLEFLYLRPFLRAKLKRQTCCTRLGVYSGRGGRRCYAYACSF
jgi:hypothetical protein